MFSFLATAEEGKPMLSCYISKELVADKKIKCRQVVRELGKYIQRWRRSSHSLLQEGKNASGIQEALNKAIDFLSSSSLCKK
jgi:alanyl-tRNA synthetase